MSDEIREVVDVLDKVSSSLIKTIYLRQGLIYLGWVVWLLFMDLLIVFTYTVGIDQSIYYIVFAVSFIIALIINNYRMPRIIRELFILYGSSRGLAEKHRSMGKMIGAVWFVAVAAYFILDYLLGILGTRYDVAGVASLAVLLGIGNLGVYVALWRYTGVFAKWGFILDALFYISIIPLFIVDFAEYTWIYGVSVIALIYLFYAVYNLLLALK